MKCLRCGKEITRGQFRYWYSSKIDGFHSEHRACSTEDPHWGKSDKALTEGLSALESYVEAREKLDKQHGFDSDLEEYQEGILSTRQLISINFNDLDFQINSRNK